MRFLLVCLVACFSCAGAIAGTAKATPPQWNFSSATSATAGDVGSFAELIRDRTYTPVDARGISMQDALRSPVRSAAFAEMSYGRVATAAAVDMAIGRAIAVATVGMATYEIASAVRCKVLGPGATGCDDGVEPETTQAYVYRVNVNGAVFTGSSAAAVCGAGVGEFNRINPPQSGAWGSTSRVFSVGTVTETTCGYTWTATSCGSTGACGYQNGDGSVAISKTLEQQTQCPASIDASNPANSIPAGAPVGVDGKCATGRYAPKTPQQVADQVAKDPNVARRAPALKEAIDRGAEVETGPGTLSGPESVSGQPTTRTETGPNGTTTTTTTPRTRFTYDGPTVTAEDDPIVVTEHPDGTTTTTEGAPPPQDIITCGLPDTPPCKIDETGTPTAGDFSGGTGAIEAERGKAVTAIEDAAKRTSLPWSWTWALPTGACTPFTFGTNARPMVVNPCDVSGVHLWRSLLAWMLAIMTGIHIWQSVKELGG